MRYMILVLGLFCSVVFSAGTARAESEQPAWYNNIGIYLAYDIDQHFSEAMANFDAKNYGDSAHNISIAASQMKLESYRASGEEHDALIASANELDELARNIERESVTSSKELSDAFSRADLALSRHHLTKAKESWADKDVNTTGFALKIASNHLERAASWAGNEGETIAADIVADTVAVAEELIKGGEWVAEDVEKAIDALAKELEKFDKETTPEKKQSGN